MKTFMPEYLIVGNPVVLVFDESVWIKAELKLELWHFVVQVDGWGGGDFLEGQERAGALGGALGRGQVAVRERTLRAEKIGSQTPVNGE